jgi:endogenous inhibitor of DNA gyrase (YacG/DUF329 family)
MTPAVCPHCGAPVELDDQRHRAVPTWWQDLFLREKPVGLSETVSNFQTRICPICGCRWQDNRSKIFGIVTPRFYWIPYAILFVFIILFGFYR